MRLVRGDARRNGRFKVKLLSRVPEGKTSQRANSTPVLPIAMCCTAAVPESGSCHRAASLDVTENHRTQRESYSRTLAAPAGDSASERSPYG